MKTSRLLLPFTHGVHAMALDYAVMLAKSRNAVLVPLSIISIPCEKDAKGIRLEHIQQSKDFLVAVQHKANKQDVLVKCVEVFVSDVVEGIKSCAQNLNCDGILLFVQDSDAVLLSKNEVKQVMMKVASKHLIIHLPSKKHNRTKQRLLKHFSQLLFGQGKQQVLTRHGNIYPPERIEKERTCGKALFGYHCLSICATLPFVVSS